MSADCVFCKIRDGQIPSTITYRDEDVLAFKDTNPRAPFHQLVVPLKHISTLSTASQDEAELLGKIMLAGAQVNPAKVKTVASNKLAGKQLKAFQAQVTKIDADRKHQADQQLIAGRPNAAPVDCSAVAGCES